ncbi:hypothetical protein Sjap_022082 [Stephania japonica]|uniref:Nudix hydrolase domain-containing protein n=1 Tax=Stephania japonica TaxID=461633 RepID=A0AAP0HUP9_9MAGN
MLYWSLVHRDGDYYRAVHVWIFAENTQELLLQRCADGKDSWPGLWDISSAGHISAGDSSLVTASHMGSTLVHVACLVIWKKFLGALVKEIAKE